MARRRKNGSFASFLFVFLLLFIISLIILVWGITTYDSSKIQQTTEEDDDLEKDDNRQFGDIVKEQEDWEEQEEKPEKESTEDDLSADDTQIEDDIKIEDAASYRRMYRQLSGEEQDIYRIVQRTLSEGESICTIEKIYGTVETAQNKLIRAIDAVY